MEFDYKKYLAEGKLLKENLIKVTKQMWDEMDDDARINALLTAMSDPGQAEDAYELAWEDLPDEATQNMYLSESNERDQSEIDKKIATIKAISPEVDTDALNKLSKVNERGGYIELMDIDSHLEAILGEWENWKNGPATEMEDIGPAREDLIEYIERYFIKALR